MNAVGLMLTFLFTFGVLALVAFSLVRIVTRDPAEATHQRPTVDEGWRASVEF
jgi:hypothetical protein